MIKAGILGAGFIAAGHAQAYAAHPSVQLKLVADPRIHEARRLADAVGATAVANAEELLGSDVDVVSICTPTPTHAPLAIAALRAGKHVLCEKPIAGSRAEAQAIIDAAEETGKKLMVGHVSRFEPDHLQAKAVLDRGALGRLRSASQSITGPFPEWSSGGWFADVEQSGGPLVDLAIHSFDYLIWLFDSPVIRVSTVGTTQKINLNTYALTTLRFANGGMALVEASWAHPRSQGLSVATELIGTHGRLSWDYGGINAMSFTKEGAVPVPVVMLGENSFVTQIAAFVDSVLTDKPPPISGHDALAALDVSLAASESLASGQPVTLSASPTNGGSGRD